MGTALSTPSAAATGDSGSLKAATSMTLSTMPRRREDVTPPLVAALERPVGGVMASLNAALLAGGGDALSSEQVCES